MYGMKKRKEMSGNFKIILVFLVIDFCEFISGYLLEIFMCYF